MTSKTVTALLLLASSTSVVVTCAFSLSMSSALIAQNKGGGHGELGFQLAKNLSSNSKISSITILQDSACDDSKEPFASYAANIPNVKIVKADLADESMSAEKLQSLLGDGERFDYVWDNASKGAVGIGQAIQNCAKEWDSKLLTYISSAGIYKPDGQFPMPETTPVKESAGQVKYEQSALKNGLPLVSFRPQYIYGKKSSKWEYIDWYFDRICNGAPLPVPGDGNQKVSLTNSADVASLLASVLNDETAAVKQTFFNCGTNNLVTYDEVALLCAETAGILDMTIEHYDPELGKASFPFRLTDFYVSPDKASDVLGWEGQCTLKEDLGWYYESYKSRVAARKVDLSVDKEVLAKITA